LRSALRQGISPPADGDKNTLPHYPSAFEKAGETLPLVLAAKELFNLS